jgi:hypothetical protein
MPQLLYTQEKNWVGPRNGLDNEEKKFLILLGDLDLSSHP